MRENSAARGPFVISAKTLGSFRGADRLDRAARSGEPSVSSPVFNLRSAEIERVQAAANDENKLLGLLQSSVAAYWVMMSKTKGVNGNDVSEAISSMERIITELKDTETLEFMSATRPAKDGRGNILVNYVPAGLPIVNRICDVYRFRKYPKVERRVRTAHELRKRQQARFVAGSGRKIEMV